MSPRPENNDTPGDAMPVRRYPSGEHDAGLAAVLDAVTILSRKVDKMMERLADGATRLALHDERIVQLGAQLAVLSSRMDRHAERQEELSDVVKAVTCDDCEERIDTLEAKEQTRADRETQAEKAAGKMPPWWLIAIVTPILGLIGSGLGVWLPKVLAAGHAAGGGP